jgi:hypothetical protein
MVASSGVISSHLYLAAWAVARRDAEDAGAGSSYASGTGVLSL